jgi:hypothetical protein
LKLTLRRRASGCVADADQAQPICKQGLAEQRLVQHREQRTDDEVDLSAQQARARYAVDFSFINEVSGQSTSASTFASIQYDPRPYSALPSSTLLRNALRAFGVSDCQVDAPLTRGPPLRGADQHARI